MRTPLLGTRSKGLGAMMAAVLGLSIYVQASASAGQKPQKPNRADEFVRTEGQNLILKGVPYRFVGANYWYGINLGAPGAFGDRPRLLRELDEMQALGIKNLRLMAGTEGPSTEPYRMLPPLQTSPGQFDESVFQGLDFLLAEMAKRGMTATMCLTNYWHWSGGMAQYVAWAQGTNWIPYPPQRTDYDSYQRFVVRFYTDQVAMNMYNNYVRTVIRRTNTVTGTAYREDPTIMAWELANEPRGMDYPEEFVAWVANSAAMIRKEAPYQLITVGSEGTTPYPGVNALAERVHALADIDFMTYHTWVQNWGRYDPNYPESFEGGLQFALQYNEEQIALAKRLGKPVVFEEFGLARDQGSFDPRSSTTIRDRYYEASFDQAFNRPAETGVVAGVSFWAYAGEGRPRAVGGNWSLGDPFIGDPPHEPQGWYSVYNSDASTLDIIRRYSARIN